jgi:hypothetical protein
MESAVAPIPELVQEQQRRVPHVFRDAPNWWYHYYSWGFGRRIRVHRPVDFTLAPYKITPDFGRLIYNFEVCHPQLGQATERKSLIVIKTAIGMSNPPSGYLRTRSYIVGFMRVEELKDGNIIMDPNESLLLLSQPLELNIDTVRRLFPQQPLSYWNDGKRTLAAKLGSLTRNRRIEPSEAEHVCTELVHRFNSGAKNYLGDKYTQLIHSRNPGRSLESFFS